MGDIDDNRERVKNAANRLVEFFDSVVVIATNQRGKDTIYYYSEAGNAYACLGSICRARTQAIITSKRKENDKDF